MDTDMTRISTLGHNVCPGPCGAVGVDLVATVRFVVIFTLLAIQARVDLSTHSNS